MSDVRIWVQLATGIFFAGLVGSLCIDPGDVFEGLHLEFLVFFEDVLPQVVTMKYLGLYQQIPVILVLFWDVLLQTLAPPRYLSPYQQTLVTLLLFRPI